MSQAKPQQQERAIDRWAVEVMRVARALRRDADAADVPGRPEALERAA